jgi:hypothetical protein
VLVADSPIPLERAFCDAAKNLRTAAIVHEARPAPRNGRILARCRRLLYCEAALDRQLTVEPTKAFQGRLPVARAKRMLS